MPRYFFQTSGSAPFTDTVGADLDDHDAAWSMAVSSMGELLRDLDGRMPDHAEIRTTVVDENGGELISLRFLAEKHVADTAQAGLDGAARPSGVMDGTNAVVVRSAR